MKFDSMQPTAAILLLALLPDGAQTCQYCSQAGPHSPSAQPAWLASIKQDRDSALKKVGYKGGVFDNQALAWTQTAYIQPQMHPYDRFFYDPIKKVYTVDRYLDDLEQRYGGIDAVLIWPTYTNIGADDRNQFDLFRSLPGGLDAVSNITRQFHDRGVRVLWPYNPWDTGTHREPLDDEHMLAKLIKQTGGDGFNGDTMPSIPQSFWKAAMDAGHPLALQPEGGGDDESLNWSTMGWGYWPYPTTPDIDRFKFLSRGKFMTNICDRWAFRKTDNLQSAWLSGIGYESWENVWGTWNGIVPRDGEAIRRVATMLRFLGGKTDSTAFPLASRDYLHSPHWEPHVLGPMHENVFASRFPLSADGGASAVYTMVNRNGTNLTGQQLWLPGPLPPGAILYDCYHGLELKPEQPGSLQRLPSAPKDAVAVTFDFEADGFGCVLQSAGPADAELAKFLARMQSMTDGKPLYTFDPTWRYLPQTMVPIAKTKVPAAAPAGTVHVPLNESWLFEVKGVEIEGDDEHGVDVQYPWEAHPQREHSQRLSVGPLFMDKYPVTTREYSQYLSATGFSPSDPYRWLLNWNGSRTPPSALGNKPVTYLSLAEARAYCAWKGARLPREYEWQYAAQGVDGRRYPWGDDNDPTRYPQQHSGSTFPGPENVTAHDPAGVSPFGLMDMVGNVYQYTDEWQDDHTRAVVLRGGSNYRPEGSNWYFPQALELGTHEKYFLMDDRYERAGTIGVRCVFDAPRE
jgi:iron(II)-dependent oxidoreductase